MLSCGAPDAHAALDNPVNLTVSLPLPVLLKIVFHIPEGCLIRQRTDGSGPESLTFAKDDFCVVVGPALVFAGKIQVYIRLFIPLKAQESLKGNIKAVLREGMSADRAELIRHVASGHAAVFFYFL